MDPLPPLALAASLLAYAHGRAVNCSLPGNATTSAGLLVADAFNATALNGTCPETGEDEGNDLGMVKVGVLTAVLVVVMISTCRLLFKMYAQFGMRDSPDGTDKAFGE